MLIRHGANARTDVVTELTEDTDTEVDALLLLPSLPFR